jgi:NAD(P)-dependent dehydrogenase (short-subunit alcohol dehydrogenase family)
MAATLSGKVVLITGGTGALGQAVTLAILQAGAQAVVTYRNEARAAELRRTLAQHGLECELEQVDVTDAPAVTRLVEGVLARHRRIDGLVHLVGGYLGGVPVAELSDQDWEEQLRLNLRSTFVCCRAVVPQMIRQHAGRIVTVSSRAAVRPGPGSAAYNVSKAGVIVLTETLAEEVKHEGVTVNCIVPSIIDTPANRQAMPRADFARWVTPAQIAELIVFLLSDAAAITGAAIPVYGQV